jgi:hypothetical protein
MMPGGTRAVVSQIRGADSAAPSRLIEKAKGALVSEDALPV